MEDPALHQELLPAQEATGTFQGAFPSPPCARAAPLILLCPVFPAGTRSLSLPGAVGRAVPFHKLPRAALIRVGVCRVEGKGGVTSLSVEKQLFILIRSRFQPQAPFAPFSLFGQGGKGERGGSRFIPVVYSGG